KTFRQKVLENHWHDLRIYFNPSANLFTLELKNQSEFLKLNCYPRYSNPNIALENSTKTYLKRMEKYNSALSKRANRFHVKLFNEKSQYKKNYDYLIDQTWSAFQQNYMSETEKGLSMTEWLDYYLQVIESEQEALNNAKFSLNNFVRHLTINQYTITSAQSTSSPIENPLEVRLCRKSGEEIEPLKVLLINNKDKTLKILNRTGATKNSIIIPSEPSTLYTVVVEGKGQIYALQNVDFEKGLNCVFLDIYNTKLLSLGEFVKKITL
ncbi:MAG: hypothetical protein MRY83_10830, partial [Flavobacteriales bacterium]|nr:hypothetical protein [Flavobacteriales bacterium]